MIADVTARQLFCLRAPDCAWPHHSVQVEGTARQTLLQHLRGHVLERTIIDIQSNIQYAAAFPSLQTRSRTHGEIASATEAGPRRH